MNINELAQDIHMNAVAHGWWEEERDEAELLALIHSEWSEALEEARAGRPQVYRLCVDCKLGPCAVEPQQIKRCAYSDEGRKPEGVAVELIDGVIRILDWFGHDGDRLTAKQDAGTTEEFEHLADMGPVAAELVPEDVPTLVTTLHSLTSHCWDMDDKFALVTAAAVALNWVRMQGIDPLEVLLTKHAYNKTRAYKHGKRF